MELIGLRIERPVILTQYTLEGFEALTPYAEC